MVEYVTPDELLARWWPAHSDVTMEDLYKLDWDELMAILGLECPDCAGQDIQIADVNTNYDGFIAVSFMEA